MKVKQLQQFLKECAAKGVEVSRDLLFVVEDFTEATEGHHVADNSQCELNTMAGQTVMITKPTREVLDDLGKVLFKEREKYDVRTNVLPRRAITEIMIIVENLAIK